MRRLTGCLFALVVLILVGLPIPAGASGSVYTWGTYGEDGRLGHAVTSPTAIEKIPSDVVQIVATNSDTYFLTGAGEVWAIGANNLGELGQGKGSKRGSIQKTPVRIPLPTISRLPDPMPYATGMALTANGTAYGWGANKYGELCLGTHSPEKSPVKLPLSGVTAATGAGGHATYDTSTGLVSCGQNQYGQLGIGAIGRNHYTPVKVEFSGPVSALSSGYGFTTILSNGTVYDFGLNQEGQLGDGNRKNSPKPVSVISGVSTVTDGGNDHLDGQTFALLSNGTFVSWGADKYGQLCNGRTTSAVERPEKLPYAPTTFTSGGSTSYFVEGGNLMVCGDNHNGEAGVRHKSASIVRPTVILRGVSSVSSTSRNTTAS
jgi:alpha-tubulin suppressor-like RCC1 family protein